MTIFHVEYQGRKCCGTCRFWEDWKDRVSARLSFGPRAPFGAAAHELRRCKYTPNPTIDYDYHPTYTDPDFTCDTWTACEGWRPKVSGTKDDSDSKA